jgi:hypothetical protein
LVTLNASDQDGDLDRIEYRLDAAGDWTAYAGPFTVTGDGDHALQYRSVDTLGHTEPINTLSFKIDATAPVLEGMPGSCVIWPPKDNMVTVAAIAASDSLSGVAPASLVISVDSNEPLTPTDVIINGGTVQVRANRRGSGEGRIYTIAAEATDLAGNTATAASTCLVPHDQSGR